LVRRTAPAIEGHGPAWQGEPNLDRLVAIFRQIVRVPSDDGLLFLPETVAAREIREDALYDGIRGTLEARLDAARLPLQVDVGFGDAVAPNPQLTSYPSLLGMPSAKVRAYPREAVIAEKFQAMVDLGIGNSRMKDFFDIWFLSRQFEYDGECIVMIKAPRLSHESESPFSHALTKSALAFSGSLGTPNPAL
jgi:hypothetical protein